MHQQNQLEHTPAYTGLCVQISDPLRETLDLFRRHPAMRILAVVDHDHKPVGVIREVDVRDLLFNPFGHALLSNPGFGMDIKGLIRSCATARHDLDSTQLIAAYSREAGSPGLILTIEGRFLETISDQQLLELITNGRMARAEKITLSCRMFTDDIVLLSDQLSKAAHQVGTLSEALGEQADGMNDAAQNVAAGAAQSSSGLVDVKERGHQLANALEQLSHVASEAKMVRARTRDVLSGAEPQMQALAKSGSEIGNIIDVIHTIGRKTNFLALNAQIEAVKHDSQNAGFVAVAGEIKQLANQTKGSAQEVSGKVDKIGKAVNDVISGHREIVVAMERMSSISGQIDAAVDEQSATSLVIAGYVEQAADATADISKRATDIGNRAHQVEASAKELERVSAMLLASAADIGERSRSFVQSVQYA